MTELNFYQLLASLKHEKPKDHQSLEACIKFLQELTSIKMQTVGANAAQNNKQ